MTWEILEGDCVEAMRALRESSIDAVVCDPPYGLEFMGKEWDALDVRQPDDPTFHKSGVGPFDRAKVRHSSAPSYGGGAGRAQQQWHHAWATEALRILKPGGHLLAFGGTRTYHRLACAVEDAGFEIRDSLTWLYGSGFPKSLDVSKAIDKAAGVEREPGEPGRYAARRPREEVEAVSAYHDGVGDAGSALVTAPATPEAAQWEGWGTALKPSHEPIVVARKPLVGTVAANVLRYGTGGINVDGCRIEGVKPVMERTETVVAAKSMAGESTGATSTGEVTTEGRWPSNVTLSHLPECVEVGVRKVKGDPRETGDGTRPGGFADVGAENGDGEPNAPVYGDEEIPAFKCAPGCPVAALDEQSGEAGGGFATRGASSQIYGGGKGFTQATGEEVGYGDSGGASRFFYTAKASRAERNAGLEGFAEGEAQKYRSIRQDRGSGYPEATSIKNSHPTVKPIDLMRWLVRLVTPPGGTVLDPFTGSGTTGIAAVLEGFDFIGIEREAEYLAIAEARVGWWAAHAGEDTDEILKRAGLSERVEREHRERGQLGLLEEAA